MRDGGGGEADTPIERQGLPCRKVVQLNPGFKSEFYSCVTLGNLLNLSDPPFHHWHKGDENACLNRFS